MLHHRLRKTSLRLADWHVCVGVWPDTPARHGTFSSSSAAASDDRHAAVHEWAVVGGGPCGVVAVGVLTDVLREAREARGAGEAGRGDGAGRIAWLDEGGSVKGVMVRFGMRPHHYRLTALVALVYKLVGSQVRHCCLRLDSTLRVSHDLWLGASFC